MKKIIIAATLLFGMTAMAQNGPSISINLLGGPQFSNFIFHNSEDVKSENLSYKMGTAFGVSMEVNGNRNIFRPEIMFQQGGAKTNFTGTDMHWKTNYLALNLGYMYSVVETRTFSLQPGLAFGVNYMVSGDQTIGSSRLNIVEEESLSRLDLEAMAFLNGKVHVTPMFSVGLEYRFGLGLLNIEKDMNQATRNINHGIMLNLGFTIGGGMSSRF